jgi:hypothetical protein
LVDRTLLTRSVCARYLLRSYGSGPILSMETQKQMIILCSSVFKRKQLLAPWTMATISHRNRLQRKHKHLRPQLEIRTLTLPEETINSLQGYESSWPVQRLREFYHTLFGIKHHGYIIAIILIEDSLCYSSQIRRTFQTSAKLIDSKDVEVSFLPPV